MTPHARGWQVALDKKRLAGTTLVVVALDNMATRPEPSKRRRLTPHTSSCPPASEPPKTAPHPTHGIPPPLQLTDDHRSVPTPELPTLPSIPPPLRLTDRSPGATHTYRLTAVAPAWGEPASLNSESMALQGMLGAEQLRGATEVHLHSCMLDLDWLLVQCPSLAQVQRIVVLHGDGRCLRARCLDEPCHRGRFLLLEPPTPKAHGLFNSKAILASSQVPKAVAPPPRCCDRRP